MVAAPMHIPPDVNIPRGVTVSRFTSDEPGFCEYDVFQNGVLVANRPGVIVELDEDNYLDSLSSSTNHGTATTAQVGALGGSFYYRPVLGCDLTFFTVGTTIKTAELRLYLTSTTITGSMSLYFDRLRRADWHETQSTWQNYKTSTAWGTAGAANTSTDIDTSVRDMLAVTDASGFQSWDVLNVVSDAVDNRTGDLAGRLSSTNESNSNRFTFVTRDESSDTERRPRLYISYEEP